MQAAGQLDGGSQVSPAPTRSSPHDDRQSSSVAAGQPAGQQPSPLTQPVMGWCTHVRVHPAADPEADQAKEPSLLGGFH